MTEPSLFPFDAVGSAGLGGIGATGATDVTGSPGGASDVVRAMLASIAFEQRTSPMHATPPTLEIGRRFETWFMPLTIDLERASSTGLGVASHVSSFLEDYQRSVRSFMHGCDTSRSGPLETSTPCGGATHQTLALESVVQVDHDESGVPTRWSLLQSSGSRAFDDAALEAVATAVRLEQQTVFTTQPHPRWSRWAFTARAYRYHRLELLDPTFVPPGERVAALSGIIGVTSVDREVRLVAIDYRE